MRFGFSKARWPVLNAALMQHALAATVQLAYADEWGTTYTVSGPLATPDRRNPDIIAYWIIRADDPRPLLTSVVPSD